MGVYIRGMEMPKSCGDCLLWENAACLASEEPIVCRYDARPQDCPLIEVPTPHGRLIDADALADESFQYELNGETSLSMVFLRDVVEAPTIIESET